MRRSAPRVTAFVVLTFGLTCAAATTEPASQPAEKKPTLVERMLAARNAEIAQKKEKLTEAREKLDAARSAAVMKNRPAGYLRNETTGRLYIIFDNPQQKRAEINARDNEVKGLTNGIMYLESLSPTTFPEIDVSNVGSIGTIRNVKVISVVNKSTIICDVSRVESGYQVMASARIEGLDASKLVDGSYIDSLGPVEVMGTVQYTTALGALRTVWRVRVIPKAELEAQ